MEGSQAAFRITLPGPDPGPDPDHANKAARAMTSDESLLDAFAKGDDEALRTLALRHEPMLLGVARGLLGNDYELARDVVQEAWTKVIRSASTFRGDCAVRSWLVRIVMNAARDAHRRRRVRHRTMGAVRERALVGAGAEPSGSGPTVATALDDREIVARALTRLPDELRECVVLCVGRGMTHAEAAELLGWPIGTLKTRLTKAMRTLRETAKELSGEA
jgi:RNA polymerase sigma-70 factor (ECF subfamily)